MKNIRCFETENEMTSAYTGDEYIEPWVSYARDCGVTFYNKPAPDYDVIGHWDGEEMRDIVDYTRLTCEDLQEWSEEYTVLYNDVEYLSIGGSSWYFCDPITREIVYWGSTCRKLRCNGEEMRIVAETDK